MMRNAIIARNVEKKKLLVVIFPLPDKKKVSKGLVACQQSRSLFEKVMKGNVQNDDVIRSQGGKVDIYQRAQGTLILGVRTFPINSKRVFKK